MTDSTDLNTWPDDPLDVEHGVSCCCCVPDDIDLFAMEPFAEPGEQADVAWIEEVATAPIDPAYTAASAAWSSDAFATSDLGEPIPAPDTVVIGGNPFDIGTPVDGAGPDILVIGGNPFDIGMPVAGAGPGVAVIGGSSPTPNIGEGAPITDALLAFAAIEGERSESIREALMAIAAHPEDALGGPLDPNYLGNIRNFQELLDDL